MKTIILLLIFATVGWSTTCSSQYRTIDGSCNNLNDIDKGKSQKFFYRNVVAYEDGISIPIGRGNARNISNALCATDPLPGFPPQFADPPKNSNSINMFESFFAQFINHDLEHNLFVEGFDNPETLVYTEVYPGDVLYRQGASNNFIITQFSEGEISEETGQFEVINNSTSWLDLSPIYGSTQDISDRLRAFQDGLLRTSSYSVVAGPPGTPPIIYDNFPPSKAVTGLPIDTAINAADADIPTSGDNRVNENISLFSIHTMWLRNHNRLARNLKKVHPTWDDEKLFQEARRYNIAEYQHITFDQYTTQILGSGIQSHPEFKYSGYKEDEVGDTSLLFSSAAFRYGHFTTGRWNLIGGDGCPFFYTIPPFTFGPTQTDPIISSSLFNAGQLGGPTTPQLAITTAGGIGNIVRGLLSEKGEEADILVSEELRSIQFQGSIGAGVDLATADMIRARLNGIPDYHTIRRLNYPSRRPRVRNIYLHRDCHANRFIPEIDPIECFLLINSDLDIATALQEEYGKVNNIDAIIGLMAEEKEEGKFLGETIGNIIFKEYVRARDADRFWYENGQFTEAELKEIKARDLSDVIRDNLLDENYHDNALQVPTKFSTFPRCSTP